MRPDAWQPDAGDLIWTDFDPSRDKDAAGSRPALVISAKAFTINTGLAIVCPIAPRIHRFPTGAVLPPGLPVSGEILISHIRGIDTAARPIACAGASIDAALAEEVRSKLAAIIAL